MGNSSSTPKVSAQDKAILDLKIQRDKIRQYQKRIANVTAREVEIARQHLRNGDKTRAQLALRRKKYQESLLSKTDKQLEQLEMLVSDVEFALVQKDVLFGLQQGTSVLKEMRKEMGGIENVEKLIGESEEEKQYQQELSEMLSGRMTNSEEDEVDEELEKLEREVLPKTPHTALKGDVKEAYQALPAAPSSEPLKTGAKDGQRAEALAA